MKILIVTDAWHPQVNGVVRTLDEVGKELVKMGHEVSYITPDLFSTIPTPSYPEIRLAVNVWKVPTMIREARADVVHIATEGPLGATARMYCAIKKIPFTTSYHTKMPEYVHMRYPFIPESFMYAYMKWLHKPSRAILVTTDSMKRELTEHGFKNNLVVWSRGVNYDVFNDVGHINHDDTKVLLYVGRVSVEKNIEAFLDVKVNDVVKIVVGDGPKQYVDQLKAKYKDVPFVGYKTGNELAHFVKNADVFVFPSKSDTFGIVMIEATACGTPVAAYPVTGPIDFIVNDVNGYMDDDLSFAIQKCLHVNRNKCADYTKQNYSWKRCAEIFLEVLADKTL